MSELHKQIEELVLVTDSEGGPCQLDLTKCKDLGITLWKCPWQEDMCLEGVYLTPGSQLVLHVSWKCASPEGFYDSYHVADSEEIALLALKTRRQELIMFLPELQ